MVQIEMVTKFKKGPLGAQPVVQKFEETQL